MQGLLEDEKKAFHLKIKIMKVERELKRPTENVSKLDPR